MSTARTIREPQMNTLSECQIKNGAITSRKKSETAETAER